MYIRKAYIRHKESYPDNASCYSAWDGFNQLGIETAPFYGFGDIDTLEDLGPEVAITGFVGDTLNALTKLGIPHPQPMDYPDELQEWLGRKVWKTTLGAVRGSTTPIFIKPFHEKKFTGFIYRGPNREAVRTATLEDEEPIWCSEIITFVTEFRAYIKDDDILGVHYYKGDWGIAPNRARIEAAVRAYKSSPRACSMDFGVTDKGETCLVEVNDSYALGNYGLPAPLYAQMIEARWEELTRA
jgi:hypothetical protein